MTAPSGPTAPDRTNPPSLRSRVAAGVVGGAGALAVTVTLAIAQAGGAASEQPNSAPAGARAVPQVATSSATGAAAPTPVTIDPGGVQANRRPVTSAAPASTLAAGGIPATALSAYRHAAASAAASCHLPWALLAGIGRVESNHGRFGGAVLHTDGVSTPAIIGIPLNGNGTEVVRDTDRGRLDGDTVYDRAVGPMQFIPSTWVNWGRDANGDGIRDPFNLYDAAAASAAYLCAAGGDLGTAVGQRTAVLTYNHSTDYLDEVLGLETLYAKQFGAAIPALPAIPRPTPSSAKAAESTANPPAATTPASSKPGSSTGPGPGTSSTRPPTGGTTTTPPTCASSTAPTTPGPTPTTPTATPTTPTPTPTSTTPTPTGSSSAPSSSASSSTCPAPKTP